MALSGAHQGKVWMLLFAEYLPFCLLLEDRHPVSRLLNKTCSEVCCACFRVIPGLRFLRNVKTGKYFYLALSVVQGFGKASGRRDSHEKSHF